MHIQTEALPQTYIQFVESYNNSCRPCLQALFPCVHSSTCTYDVAQGGEPKFYDYVIKFKEKMSDTTINKM